MSDGGREPAPGGGRDERGRRPPRPPAWPEVRAVAEAALARPPEARSTFLDRACADAVLRREVEAQLRACDRATRSATFLAAPAAAFAASLFGDGDPAGSLGPRPEPDLPARLQQALGGAYDVERELGGGGMSRVFVARDARLGRTVAVKVLHPDRAAGLSAAWFAREVRLAARLQHPHVLPLLSAGEVDGLPYYTMPYVDGETLRARLARDGPLPVAEAVRLVRELADALAYAHREGVVHRDLKPENVLLSGGHAVVADFGVAKALASAAADGAPDGGAEADGVTAAGVLVGTPAYMAPEQIACAPGVDHRADLYALGVVAYELLAGVRPHLGGTPQAIAAAQRTGPPPALDARRPDVPPALAALVLRLLATEPGARPRHAGEVLDALDGLAAPGGGSTPPRPDRPVARRRVVGLALAATVVAGTAVWGRWSSAPTRAVIAAGLARDTLTSRRVLVVPFTNATGDATLAPVGRMIAEWLSRGLAETGVVDVVMVPPRPNGAGAESPEVAAAASGAGIVVSGTYFLAGDSVRAQARITDVTRRRLVAPVAPVSAPRSTPPRLLDTLRRRVAAAVAAGRDPSLAAVHAPPPDYDAYRQFAAGWELFERGDLAGALPYLARAAATDSTFVTPRLVSAQALLILHQDAGADSVLRPLARRREAVPPAERGVLDRLRAEVVGDRAGQLAGARAIRRAAPGWYLGYFLEAQEAVKANRPREALDAAAHLAADSALLHGFFGGANYWRAVADARHLLGDYAGELAVARAERVALPDQREGVAHELRALAALGQIADLAPGLDTLEGIPAARAAPVSAVLADLADELDAHGHVAAAQRVRRRVVASVAARADAEQTPAALAARGRVLSSLGRFAAADGVLARLARRYPAEPAYLAEVGLNCARRGRRADADRAAARLAHLRRPYDRGQTSYARARLAAALGDRDGAAALLRQALGEGAEYGPALHADPAFARMRSDARFAEVLRPKG